MGQQILQTVIALSGRVDNSFGKIGEALLSVGSQIDALSQQIINFGKESVEEYVDYDDIMREVQALGEYDDKTMRVLNEYNKSIAQTSKYTMEQAAQAEVMMAQLGLNMDQTKTLMPTVMNLATAANIDLADSLDYLYYTLNALGMPMEYANTLSDQMSKAAAISAADIDTLGQSMQRLGSGVQFFAGGSSEILAILGGISQFGSDMQGSNAGTQLRNFMLTLLAPTQSKEKLISSLKVTEAEWAEFESYMEDAEINVTDTAAAMNQLGLSVYDSTTGELKPAIQIIGELDAALSTLTEEEKNAMLGNLFGKRTTTTALNLMNVLETIIEYKNLIENGSTGYTESMAQTMEGGLGGALREFSASWNAFKVTIGETVAPTIENVADGLTNIVNGLNDMDEGTLNALVSGAKVLAGAGPALIATGTAFRLIGYVLTPAGAVAIGVTTVLALAKAIHELNEAKFESNFGDMELDTETLLSHVNALGSAFNQTYTEIDSFNGALQTAVDNYTSASTTLASKLLTNMITGATLTKPDKETLRNLGSDMHTALLKGITNSTAASMSYLEMLFGGPDSAVEDDEFNSAILLAHTMYKNLVGQAEQLGREFGETLGAAMDDGIITGDEYNAIMEKMKAYDDAIAFMEQADQAGELAERLHKAKSVSWDSVKTFLAEQASIMNANLEHEESTYAHERAYQEAVFNYAISNGWINNITGEAYTEEDKNSFLSALEARHNAKMQGFKDDNAKVAMAAYDALMSQSGYGEAWQFLSRLYANGDLKRDEYGEVTWDAVDWASLFPDGMPTFSEDNPLAEQLYDLWRGEHGISGIGNKLTGILEPYMDSESIALIPQMLDDALTIMDYVYGWDTESGRDVLDNSVFETGVPAILEAIEQGIANGNYAGIQTVWTQADQVGTDRFNQVTYGLKSVYDFERVLAEMGGNLADQSNPYRDQIAAYQLMYGNINADDYLITANVEPVLPEGAVQDAAGEQTIPATIEPETTTDATSIDVEVPDGAADATTYSGEFQGALDANVLAASVNYPSGYADGLSYATSYQSALDSNPARIRVSSSTGGKGLTKYAEGGRATTASIFGEAGPEWAIPEEHTERVASLFNAAREAAGFTWPELVARNGGLNAGGAVPAQIIYSPTIVAGDATGVEQKLIEDKARLDRWWQEKQMREDVEVYA